MIDVSLTGWRSLVIAASVCVSLATAQAAPSVAIDLTRLETSDAAALEQALVMRLLQEGFAIDPLVAKPTIVVAITGPDRELVLSARTAHFERSRTIDISGSSGAQRQLELVQRVVELARLAREAVPSETPTPTATTRADVLRATTLAGREHAPRWRLGADVGVESSASVEIALHARFAIAHGVGAIVHVDAAQPDAPDISVDEQELFAGAGYEHSLTKRLALDVSLVGGVRRHHFELAMPLADRTGTRWDPVIALPLRMALRPLRWFDLSLWGIAKLGREREHVNGAHVLWHRDAFGIAAGAGVAARF